MPVFFPIILILMALMFTALPVAVITSMVKARNRQKTWVPTNATVSRVHMETRGTNDSRRTAMVGTYEYYDRNEQIHTGSGDLGSQGVAVDGSPQVIQIVVDPLDPTRSQIVQPTSGGKLACAAIFTIPFAIIGLIMLMTAVGIFVARG